VADRVAAVSCQICAVPRCANVESAIVAVEPADNCLLMTMTVRAPSADRSAAKADTTSGLAVVAATLVSPNADLLPS
jgi:hypothetical protein